MRTESSSPRVRAALSGSALFAWPQVVALGAGRASTLGSELVHRSMTSASVMR